MPHTATATATATATEHPRCHRVFRRARKFCHIFSSFTFNFFHDLLVVFVAALFVAAVVVVILSFWAHICLLMRPTFLSLFILFFFVAIILFSLHIFVF